jgi:hypothetical protein
MLMLEKTARAVAQGQPTARAAPKRTTKCWKLSVRPGSSTTRRPGRADAAAEDHGGGADLVSDRRAGRERLLSEAAGDHLDAGAGRHAGDGLLPAPHGPLGGGSEPRRSASAGQLTQMAVSSSGDGSKKKGRAGRGGPMKGGAAG